MKHAIARCGWSALLLASGLPGTAQAQPSPAPAATASLEVVSEVQLSPRLREITLRSTLLATGSLGLLPANPLGQTKVRVLLPAGYEAAGRTRYPVLYLYHGGGGNQTEWTTPAAKGDAEGLTQGLPLIVVMPEGGVAGGYADWFNGGAFGAPRWKTYHLDQLVPWIDAKYRTIANRSGRATAGLSMGGGGLRYAEIRPDLFGATAAFSGDIDILQPASDWVGMGAPISKMIWGDRKTEEVRWRGVNGPDLAKNLSNTNIAIFAGDTGRPEATYILPGSLAVHDRLAALGIAHTFEVYPGMTHSWPTWNRALAQWLPRLMGYFGGPGTASRTSGRGLRGAPPAFSYSSIAPSYSLYGWDVSVERAATEFSALEVSDARRFTIVGSGKAVVHTPVLGTPNTEMQAVIVNRDRPDLSGSVTVRTDARGRIVVPVPLGPANSRQQYSAATSGSAAASTSDKAPFLTFDDSSRFYRAEVSLKPK